LAETLKETMSNRWGDKVTDYPHSFMVPLLVNADQAAVNWIDKNKPQHWARGVFASNLPHRSDNPAGHSDPAANGKPNP
jgi:hypothetical protein